MLSTVATLLIITWPGYTVPRTSYPSQAACERAAQHVLDSGHGVYRRVPGFKAVCVPEASDLIS
jgi:hypothetical protein